MPHDAGDFVDFEIDRTRAIGNDVVFVGALGDVNPIGASAASA
jgi:hypothetical protein